MAMRRRLESWLSWFPWYRRRAREAELARELQAHLELEAEEQQAAGVSTEEAAHAAHRAFGNVLRIEEDVRDVWRWRRLEDFLIDIRYAMRMLRKSPGFTAIAVLILALGIGANTAMFSIVDAVLFHSLPYREPGRLVWLTEALPNAPDNNVSWLDMQDWKTQNHVFEGIAGYYDSRLILEDHGKSQILPVRYVSEDYFNVMGVPPLLGRAFRSEEHRVGGPPAVVLSHSFWMEHFGGNPSALGKTLQLSNKACVVVGIMPAGFGSVTFTKIWAPYEESMPKVILTHRQFSWGMYAVARLKPSVSFEQAKAEITGISRRLEQEYPKTTGGLAVMQPLAGRIVGGIRPALLMLSAAVFFLFLIACTNIAGLLLTRAVGKQKEIAVRVALGAGKWRLFQQSITENMMLSAAGAAAGLLMAFWGTKYCAALLPANVPFASFISVNRMVLLFTVGLALLAATLLGLAPAVMGLRTNVQHVLKSGTHQIQGGHRRTHRALVITEVALATALLIGAGLMMRSMVQLFRVNPGFDTHGLLTETVLLTGAYTHSLAPEQIGPAFDQVVRRVKQLPGVASAAAVAPAPFSTHALQQWWNLFFLAIKGRLPHPGKPLVVHVVTVSTNYFRTLRIPLIAGRTFTPADTWDAQRVAVIDEELAKRYWPGQNPVGDQIKIIVQNFGDPSQKALTIVGVVGTVKAGGLDADFGGDVYFPQNQRPSGFMTIIVRSRVAPLSLARSVQSAIHQATPGSPVTHVQTMDEMVLASQATRGLCLRLLGGFSIPALVLAVLGLYGVLSYAVSQSANEIGVRMAVGAGRADIMRLFLGQGMRLALSGTLVGIASAAVLTRFMASLLYGAGSTDPATFIGVSLLLILVALAACYIPARRATRVDPMTALRNE